MKHRMLFCKKVLAFAMLLILSHSMKICSQTCIDFSQGTSGLYALLQSMWPAHTIIKDSGDETTTIGAGGSYQIMENITGSIIIDADDVYLDLNGFTVSGDTDPLILISEGKQNIMIKNGAFEGSVTNIGLQIDKQANTIVLEDLRISNCDKGMLFNAAECEPITCAKVDNCFTTSCVKGYVLKFAEKVVFEKCQACCCQESGFDLYHARFNKFKECKAIGIGNAVATSDAFGFTSVGGFDNLFYECFAEGVHKDGDSGDGTWCKKAIGFNFGFADDDATLPEMESKIINCLVDTVKAPASSWYHAMGIRFDALLAAEIIEGPVGSFTTKNSPTIVDWSPQCDLIAIAQHDDSGIGGGDDSGGFKLVRLIGTDLIETASYDVADLKIESLQFSPCGRYLLFTDSDGANHLSIYDVKKHMVVATFNAPAVTGPLFYVPYARWANCSNRIILSGRRATVAANGTSYYVLAFNGSSLNLLRTVGYLETGGATYTDFDISPDDKFIAAAIEENTEYFTISDLNNFVPAIGSQQFGDDPRFNPTICCGKYYIASLLSRTSTLFISHFDSVAKTLTLVTTFVAPDGKLINDYKWHPTGKYLAVEYDDEAGNVVAIFRFNPQGPTYLEELYEYTPTRIFLGGAVWIDWSPCGNYLVIYGDKNDSDPFADTEIIELGNCVKCCVADHNKIANVNGGMCGIGIFGASCCNGITRNVGYGNCVNFSQGIYNKYCNGLSGPHSLLGNWSIPPY